jgi:hypothetical protein
MPDKGAPIKRRLRTLSPSASGATRLVVCTSTPRNERGRRARRQGADKFKLEALSWINAFLLLTR